MLTSGSIHESPRRQVYAPILSKVRVAIIQRMARPEEVLVTEDDNGNLIRQHLKDTDAITLYNNMRETLVYLSHLDPIDTVTIMERKLSQQVRRTSRSLFHVLSFTNTLQRSARNSAYWSKAVLTRTNGGTTSTACAGPSDPSVARSMRRPKRSSWSP